MSVDSTTTSADYLNQLLSDKKFFALVPPNIFLHAERLLDLEIVKVRNSIFSLENHSLDLPPENGPKVSLSEKVFLPVEKFPQVHIAALRLIDIICMEHSSNLGPRDSLQCKHNFVGRLLGPRGRTIKEIEQSTGCQLFIRGKGSCKHKKTEEENLNKPNWEHLKDPLHVLIKCEDTEQRAKKRLKMCRDAIEKLAEPKPDGEDGVKKRQLIELAIINGTYRESNNNNPVITNNNLSPTLDGKQNHVKRELHQNFSVRPQMAPSQQPIRFMPATMMQGHPAGMPLGIQTMPNSQSILGAVPSHHSHPNMTQGLLQTISPAITDGMSQLMSYSPYDAAAFYSLLEYPTEQSNLVGMQPYHPHMYIVNSKGGLPSGSSIIQPPAEAK